MQCFFIHLLAGASWTYGPPLCWTRHDRGQDICSFNDDRRGRGSAKRSWDLTEVKDWDCSLHCVQEKSQRSTKRAYWWFILIYTPIPAAFSMLSHLELLWQPGSKWRHCKPICTRVHMGFHGFCIWFYIWGGFKCDQLFWIQNAYNMHINVSMHQILMRYVYIHGHVCTDGCVFLWWLTNRMLLLVIPSPSFALKRHFEN